MVSIEGRVEGCRKGLGDRLSQNPPCLLAFPENLRESQRKLEKARDSQRIPGNLRESQRIYLCRALPPLQFSENLREIFSLRLSFASFLCESQGIFLGDLFSFGGFSHNSSREFLLPSSWFRDFQRKMWRWIPPVLGESRRFSPTFADSCQNTTNMWTR
jgi:hypothetical protein